MRRPRPTIPLAAFASTAALALAACGGGTTLSAEAEAGRSIFRSSGCASCHGADGQGGIGPALQGLWGETVVLDDGSTVIADPAYLRRSIREPQAQIVEGYPLPMPASNLNDEAIDSVLDFIEAIGPDAEAGG